MRLAHRTYLYRLFHIMFGVEPDRGKLELFGCPQSIEALAFYEKEARIEAPSFGQESLPDAPVMLERAQDTVRMLAEKAADGAYVDGLRSVYTALFVLPGPSHVKPWESFYVGKEVTLFQPSTLDVREIYGRNGFQAAEFRHFPEDHLSMMLDFLGNLGEQAYDAFGASDDREVGRLLGEQRMLIDGHLVTWLDRFSELVGQNDASGVYACLAHALVAFLACDRADIEKTMERGA